MGQQSIFLLGFITQDSRTFRRSSGRGAGPCVTRHGFPQFGSNPASDRYCPPQKKNYFVLNITGIISLHFLLSLVTQDRRTFHAFNRRAGSSFQLQSGTSSEQVIQSFYTRFCNSRTREPFITLLQSGTLPEKEIQSFFLLSFVTWDSRTFCSSGSGAGPCVTRHCFPQLGSDPPGADE